jgi:prenyltransferase beta subunit
MSMHNSLKKIYKSMPLDWMLAGETYVKYRVMTDLLDPDRGDRAIRVDQPAIRRSQPVKQIFTKRNQQGYWGTPGDIYKWWPKKDSTFWMLGILADFGLTRNSRDISIACEYVFGTQLPDGGFGWAPPPRSSDCFTGILTESLAKLGYQSDSRLRQAYGWLMNRQRNDGGFWCKNTGLPGRPRQHEPSCAFATLCVLGALSMHSELKNSDEAKRSVGFLLECWKNRGKIKYAGHDSQVGTGWEKLKYPFSDYRILKYLDILTRFDFAKNNPAMDEMTALLISKADEEGRFKAEAIHKCWSDFDFGQKKSPSRFITMMVYRILKRLI